MISSSWKMREKDRKNHSIFYENQSPPTIGKRKPYQDLVTATTPSLPRTPTSNRPASPKHGPAPYKRYPDLAPAQPSPRLAKCCKAAPKPRPAFTKHLGGPPTSTRLRHMACRIGGEASHGQPIPSLPVPLVSQNYSKKDQRR